MIFPLEKNLVIPQGYAGELDAFWVPGDYSSTEITMMMKASTSLSASSLFELTNTAAGGNDDLLTATLDGVHTKITPKLRYANTSALTGTTYYYELVAKSSEADRVILYRGQITLLLGTIGDDQAMAYPGYNNYARVRLTPPDTFAAQTATGFDGTLSYAIAGNVVTVTSTESDFDDSYHVVCNGMTAMNAGTTTLKIWLADGWDTDYDFLDIEIYKR